MSVAPSTIKHGQLILQAFEESMSYWCALKNQVEEHFHLGNKLVNQDGSEILDIPRYVHKQLLEHLQLQQNKIRSIASSGQFIIYVQAQYALVALIDDQLLRMVRWPHQQDWLSLLLETSFFSSRNAGHKLIQRVEELIETDNVGHQVSPPVKQLAYVYLCVFWQGFKGKLFNNPSKLEYLRKALTEICEFEAIDLTQKHLLSQPYQYNRNNEQAGRLAPISKWHRVTMIAVIIYLLLSTGLWGVLTKDLSDRLQEVTQSSSTSNR